MNSESLIYYKESPVLCLFNPNVQLCTVGEHFAQLIIGCYTSEMFWFAALLITSFSAVFSSPVLPTKFKVSQFVNFGKTKSNYVRIQLSPNNRVNKSAARKKPYLVGNQYQ